MSPELKGMVLLWVVKILSVFTALMVGVMMVIWAERRVSGWIQDRLGPNRVGPQGLLQSVADGAKNILKEETIPAQADRTLFFLAPVMSFMPALLLFAVVPFAAPLAAFDGVLPIPVLGSLIGRISWAEPVPLVIADLPIGILFILAISSLGVYGIVLAGWASNSKYAFLGGLRASAQMVSYEIALALSLIVVLILAGDVTLSEIVATQQASTWFVFPLTAAFILFFISALAETNRLPFDLCEAEAELVSGYHTEYSAMKFSMFFIAEYAAIITMSALLATLYFGGWDVPFTTWDDAGGGLLVTAATLAAFSIKLVFFVFCYIWIRWTLPRFRFDQLMALGWKVLLPGALGYIVLMATVVWLLDGWLAFGPGYAMVLFGVNLVVLWGAVWWLDRGRLIAGIRRRPGREEAH